MTTSGEDSNPPVSRREALSLLGGAGAAVLGGTTLGRAAVLASPFVDQHLPPSLACVASPAQTEGPYFVEERLERSDLRIDPSNGSIRPGAPLRLRLNVVKVDGAACAPVSGALVDIWQCDAVGIYSDVRDFQGLFDTRGQKFLRGHQITGRDGGVEFLTIYPGWYSGRAVHIHFKVRLAPNAERGHEFTSQLYFDEALTDAVHARPPYNTKGKRDTLNTADRTFRGIGRDGLAQSPSGSSLMLNVTRDGNGYVGAYGIGLRLA